MSNYKGILTNKGKELLASATMGNRVNFSHLALGDGNGSVPTLNEGRTGLVKERHRLALNSVDINPNNRNQIICETIIPSNVGGFTVRELGLYVGSVLIMHSTYPPTYKPRQDEGGAREMVIRVVINVQNADVIALYLDTSLVYATREWVETNFVNHNEVIDSLVGTEVNKPLSANMGKKLNLEKVGIAGNVTITGTKTFSSKTDFSDGLRLSSSSRNIWAALGVGTSDVHLGNPVSNKFLQLKDNGVLGYSNSEIYHQGRKPRFDEIEQVPNLITNPTQITEGDLDTYTAIGFYYCDSNAQARTITNTPVNLAFALEVIRSAGVTQICRQYNSSNVFIRAMYDNTWSPWTRLATVNDNAPTATKLQTARTINGIAFDGSQDITIVDSTKLPSNGNATSASKLQTARTLSLTGDATASLTFDGSANVSNNLTLASSGVTAGSYNSVTVDAKGRVTRGLTQTHGLITATTATGTANTATTNTNTFLNIVASGVGTTSSVGSSTQITGTNGITVSSDTAGKLIISQDIANNLTDTSAGKSLSAAQGKVLNDSKLGKTEKAVSASTADTATKLQTARTINGIAFDGTTNITIADDTKLPSGANAVSATKLVTARRIDLAGAVTGNANFDGSANITINTALKAVQRTERTGTLIPTNNSFKNLTVDVAGVVEVYPDGRIVQSFSFVAPVRYFHRHSAQAFYRTTLGIANFVAGEDNPILEMPLWTAMPNKVSEARVHLSSGPAHHAYSEANEWIYDWDAIFNQQANIKDKAYFSFRRWTGGSDEPVTFNIVVEGY